MAIPVLQEKAGRSFREMRPDKRGRHPKHNKNDPKQQSEGVFRGAKGHHRERVKCSECAKDDLSSMSEHDVSKGVSRRGVGNHEKSDVSVLRFGPGDDSFRRITTSKYQTIFACPPYQN